MVIISGDRAGSDGMTNYATDTDGMSIKELIRSIKLDRRADDSGPGSPTRGDAERAIILTITDRDERIGALEAGELTMNNIIKDQATEKFILNKRITALETQLADAHAALRPFADAHHSAIYDANIEHFMRAAAIVAKECGGSIDCIRATDYLTCDVCGKREAAPFAPDDKCKCGGTLKEADDDAEKVK